MSKCASKRERNRERESEKELVQSFLAYLVHNMRVEAQ